MKQKVILDPVVVAIAAAVRSCEPQLAELDIDPAELFTALADELSANPVAVTLH